MFKWLNVKKDTEKPPLKVTYKTYYMTEKCDMEIAVGYK